MHESLDSLQKVYSLSFCTLGVVPCYNLICNLAITAYYFDCLSFYQLDVYTIIYNGNLIMS